MLRLDEAVKEDERRKSADEQEISKDIQILDAASDKSSGFGSNSS